MRGEGGQATVEWAGLVLLVMLVLLALSGFRFRSDGDSTRMLAPPERDT